MNEAEYHRLMLVIEQQRMELVDKTVLLRLAQDILKETRQDIVDLGLSWKFIGNLTKIDAFLGMSQTNKVESGH